MACPWEDLHDITFQIKMNPLNHIQLKPVPIIDTTYYFLHLHHLPDTMSSK